MGGFFRRVLEQAGHPVLVSGRTTSLTARDLALQCDVLMISVPIRDTVAVIEEVTPLLTPHQILCDLTSVKMKPMEAMLRSRAKVVGLHPMFGPSVSSLYGQTIIVTPGPDTEVAQKTLLQIFRERGAILTLSTPEEHDRLMAIIQGLTHFSTLCMAETMRSLGTDLDRALTCTSPIYRIEMGLIGRLLGQDPDLYGDMLTWNPFVPPVIEAFQVATQHLTRIVAEKDRDAFRRYFTQNTHTFEEYCDRAAEETDALIEYLVGR
jgi:prephenate dehydrogenase